MQVQQFATYGHSLWKKLASALKREDRKCRAPNCERIFYFDVDQRRSGQKGQLPKIEKRFGPIDILINKPKSSSGIPLEDMEVADFSRSNRR